MTITKRIDIGNLPISKIHTKVDDLKKRFEGLSKDLKVTVPGRIVDDICDAGVDKANELNDDAPRSGVDGVTIKKQKDKGVDNHGLIVMSGNDAVYDEFGTGEEGASDPHPMKSEFGLNPYNSGPFVSTHIDDNGRHYWFYSDMEGMPYFYEGGLTYGIPSGKQMYNTLQYVRQIKGEIISKHINESLDDAMGRK